MEIALVEGFISPAEGLDSSPKNEVLLSISLNCIRWWSSGYGNLENVKYTFIDIYFQVQLER